MGLGSLGSLRDARKDAEAALKKMQAQEKIRFEQHKKLRDLLSKRIHTAGSLFELMDVDMNGLISREEFRDAMATMGGEFIFPARVYDELFAEFDADGSGEISYKEYFQYVLRDSIRRKASLFRDFFLRADSSGDGTIDKLEFRQAVVRLHGEGSHDMELLAHSNEIDEIFDEMDKDGSGTLSMHELHKHLRVGMGMGKFTKPKHGRSSPDTVVKRTKSSSRLRGSLSEQYLMCPHTDTNAAFFDHSLNHHPKYVERTAVAKAAYELIVDDRLDTHLNSDVHGRGRIKGRGGGSYKPVTLLHSSSSEVFPPPLAQTFSSKLKSAELEPLSFAYPYAPAQTPSPPRQSPSPPRSPFTKILHTMPLPKERAPAFPPPPSPPRRANSPPLYRSSLSSTNVMLPVDLIHHASLLSLITPPSSPEASLAPPSPMRNGRFSPNRSFAHLQPLPTSPVSPAAPTSPTSPWRKPWPQAANQTFYRMDSSSIREEIPIRSA